MWHTFSRKSLNIESNKKYKKKKFNFKHSKTYKLSHDKYVKLT